MMKVRAFGFLILLLAMQACASSGGPRSIRTGDVYSRIIAASPEQIVQAATVVIRDLQLPLAHGGAGSRMAMSGPVTMQGRWGNVPLSERLLCGTATAEGFDAAETRRFTDEIPIEVRMGFVVEPRLDESLTTLTFEGVGQRRSSGPLFNRQLPCAPTQEFVRQLFGLLEAQLAADLAEVSAASASR